MHIVPPIKEQRATRGVAFTPISVALGFRQSLCDASIDPKGRKVHPRFSSSTRRPTLCGPRIGPPVPSMTRNFMSRIPDLDRTASSNLDVLREEACRMLGPLVLSIALLATSFCGPQYLALAEVPQSPPETYFLDDSGLLAKSQISFLEQGLSSLRDTSGFNVRYVNVRSLGFEISPQEYAAQLFEQWNLGSKDVLVVSSTKLAKAAIVAGSEAQKILVPEITESIASATYALPAGQERYTSAAADVVNRLIPILKGEKDPGPPRVTQESASGTFKSKEDTKEGRGKAIKVVGILLVLSFVIPFIQYWWYVKDQ
mmetsp:Transcript_398/g.671  ORF Transcript_398/g.671 Transcript_398/m.671 type:complete len:314 (+) Transcript_398:258-1199(+)